MIPAFNPDGNLPPGIHEATWQEVEDRYGRTGRRRRLLTGLYGALTVLRDAGCQTVWINGSFVTAKAAPGDFNACWDVADVDPTRLDPVLQTFDAGRRRRGSAASYFRRG